MKRERVQHGSHDPIVDDHDRNDERSDEHGLRASFEDGLAVYVWIR